MKVIAVNGKLLLANCKAVEPPKVPSGSVVATCTDAIANHFVSASWSPSCIVEDTTPPPAPKYSYNGVVLPEIPSDVLAQYPYAWIRKHTTNGVYQLMLSATGFYFETGGVVVDKGSVVNPQYIFPIGGTTGTAWANANNGTYYRWTVDDARPCMWSNHDIPNGSATSTEIYFEGSEPVLAE